MKKVISLLIVGLFLITSVMGVLSVHSEASSNLSISEINMTRTYQPPVISSSVFDKIEISGLESYYQEGKPVIPFEPVTVLIPQGEEPYEILVLEGVDKMLDGKYNFEITQGSKPTGIENEEEAKYTTWEGGVPYFPPETFSDAGTHIYRGYSLLTINVFPLTCYADGTISYYETIHITIKTRPSEDFEKGNMFRGLEKDREEVLSRADDVSMLSDYDVGSSIDALLPGAYDYAIITDESLIPEFQSLVDWKNSLGISTTIKTVQEIQVEYQGDDLQEKIRNFIRDAYVTWNIDYVLLGGDVEIIPHRGFYGLVGVEYEDFDIPADIYYAALDGTWDDDGDKIWGEIGEDDLYAEVYVGRAPVNNPQEVARFVEKIIAYESVPSESPVITQTIFSGQALDNVITWGGDYKDKIEKFIPSNYNISKYYDKDGTFSKLDIIGEINNGTHLINNMGHGNIAQISGMNLGDIDLMTNEDYFIWYSQSCSVASYDNRNTVGGSMSFDSIAEQMVTSEDGGAVAFLGNSRYGWYTPGHTSGTSQLYDEEFFNVLFNKEETKIGKTHQISKEKFAPVIWILGSYRWVYFSLNLLGDPTLSINGNVIDSPDNLQADPGNSFVDLTWDAPENSIGVTNYNIYKGTNSGNEVFYTTIGNVLSYTDNDVTNGITYYYKVSAISNEGESGFTNEANASPGIPSEPIFLTATPGDSEIILSWTPPLEDGGHQITNYMVYRGTTILNLARIITLGNITNYYDGSIINGQRYYYRITAYNSLFEGYMSNRVDAITGIPSEPLNLQASPGDNHVWLTWEPPLDDGGLEITNYIIYRGTVSGKVVYLETSSNDLEYIDYNVLPETTYYYRVSTQNTAFEGSMSNEAGAMPFTIRWPMFRRDIGNTGFASVNTSTNDLNLKWSFLTDDFVSSSPSIDKDGTIYFGSDDGNLYAMHPGGRLEWTYSTGNKICTSSPAVAPDGTIYIGSYDKNLHAVNPDGILKWKYRTPKAITTSPAIGPDGTIYFGSDNNRFYALNPDGTVKWFFRTRGNIRSSPALGTDGTVYFGCDDNRVIALDSDGKLKWSYTTNDKVSSSPAIGQDGTVYIGSYDGNLYALSYNGYLRWKYQTDGIVTSSPSVDQDENIYISSADGNIYSLNSGGVLNWKYSTSDYVSLSSPAIDSEGNIHIGAGTNIISLNPNGTLKCSYSTGNLVASSPAVDIDGTIYVGSTDGKLYSFVNNSYNGPIQNVMTGESFDFIQAAIDDSDTLDGHIITVAAGAYTENVIVNKKLTIMGENRDTAIVSGGGSGHVFHVIYHDVQISGLTIKDAGPIFLDSGIMIEDASNVRIYNNIISSNPMNGIRMIDSDSAQSCLVEDNIISSNYYGIYVWLSNDNIIRNNDVQMNNYGIHVWDADSNIIESNTISFNNGIGITLQGAEFNSIYHNSIFDNSIQASESDGLNTWDDGYPSGGNYWGDYVGMDLFSGPAQDIPGSDDFGDLPYTGILGAGVSVDSYPVFEGGITIVRIEINPDTAQVTANEDLKFIAQAFDENDNEVQDIIFSWATDVGVINQAGFFTAQPLPETGYVEAAFGELFTRASVAILSNNSYTFNLTDGWNLVSIPLIPDITLISDVLVSIQGKWDRLKYYDAQDKLDSWKTYSVYSSSNDITDIQHTMGFWLHTTEECQLTITGSRPIITDINLYAGWNLVGFPRETSLSIESTLAGTSYDMVEAFDAESPYMVSQLTDMDLMNPGSGYWVHVTADTVWTVNW